MNLIMLPLKQISGEKTISNLTCISLISGPHPTSIMCSTDK